MARPGPCEPGDHEPIRPTRGAQPRRRGRQGVRLDLLRGRLGPHRLKHALGLGDGGGVVRQNVHHLGRNWNDWQGTIDVPRAALSGFNWTRYSGGATSVAPREFLHANMSCAVIPDGANFGHSCQHGPPPHIIKVCIVKSDNRRIFPTLAGLASNGPGQGTLTDAE